MPSGHGARIRPSPVDPNAIPAWVIAHASRVFSVRGDIVSVTGSRATSWTDQSGRGNHWTAAAGNITYPTLVSSAVNGWPALYSNGGTDYLENASIGTSMTVGEIFLVGKRDEDPPAIGNAGWWRFGSDGSNIDYIPYSDGVIYDGFGSTLRKATVNPAASLANPFCYNVTSKSGGWTSRLNGTQIYTTASNTVGWSATKRLFDSLGSRLKGYVAEVHMFSAELTTQERADMHTYLRGRYGFP